MQTEILESMKNIAVVGFSPNPEKDSHTVGAYLIEQGYNVYPIYPTGDEICGRKVYRSLSEISDPIDTVVMFRKGEYASKLFEEVLAKGAKNFWLQLGIRNDAVGDLACERGINYVQDACIMFELKRKNYGKSK